MFTAWLQARAAGDRQLQAALVRRFTPEYRSAFQAWLRTDPFTDPDAPPGPGYMPGYRNPQLKQAEGLNAQAADAFEEGTAARETADRYVRVTVLFALVLFLIAVAQRFRTPGVRGADRGERGRHRPAAVRPLHRLHPAAAVVTPIG